MASYEEARQVKQRYEADLLKMKNVVGVGIGLRQIAGTLTDEISLIVMVKKKLKRKLLSKDEVIPQELEGIFVDVQEVGEIQAGS